ncbi:hypothetical protein [Helicobacter sp. 11S03491-1]|uniref:hypothetical protein n=1 Tax=Helicobacter sp. 11S03491-1 TaxID=1476196 RepID=UPI000BA68037|nr:hypothetical protein [Helicobacter sp. 11S03491-1]PAF42019.1 hypothetical protein BKH45_05415 [Helicobacter sp. 11S03491-1]
MEKFLWLSLFGMGSLCLLYLWCNTKYLKPYEKYLAIIGGIIILPMPFVDIWAMVLVSFYVIFSIFTSYKIIKIKNESKDFLVFIGLIALLALFNLIYFIYMK